MVESGPISSANSVSTRAKPWLQPAPKPPLTRLRIRVAPGNRAVTMAQLSSPLALSITITRAAAVTEATQAPITRPLWWATATTETRDQASETLSWAAASGNCVSPMPHPWCRFRALL